MYGQRFIDVLKAEGQYGDIFSYEQYQDCKKCASMEDFAQLWAKTAYSEVPVYSEPKHTYQHQKLLIERNCARDMIWQFFSMGQISIFTFPIFGSQTTPRPSQIEAKIREKSLKHRC